MSESLAEQGVTASATVVSGLGYPNNRVEASAHPTGWQASEVLASGTPNQEHAIIEKIQK
jgi:hypothetical protein